MRFIDFFCGIGGFTLGLTRAGLRCVGACEIEESARTIYLKNFPETEWFPNDITKVTPSDIPAADLWCGGFPCQDISATGLRAGISGSRSGLFFTLAELARVVRPRFILLENVSALLGRGMGSVLGKLSEIGYDAEWEIISAAAMGAPYIRERVWILAYPKGGGFTRNYFADETTFDPKSGKSGGWAFQPADLPLPAKRDGRTPHRLDVRVADGVPGWVDAAPRIKALGNAVVPQIPEMIGRRLMGAIQFAPDGAGEEKGKKHGE